MATKINGVAVGATFVGALFVWSGIKGYSVPHALQALVQGKAPSTGGQANPIVSNDGSSVPKDQQTGPAVSGTVDSWIDRAFAIDPSISGDRAALHIIITYESGGNPLAQNNSDSNAAAGNPSKGIMQTIQSTFDAYALPGHTNIWNPVDNIIAGSRYAISRYGSLSNVPGVLAVRAGKPYVGY